MELKTLNRIEEMMQKHSLTLGRIREKALRISQKEEHSEQGQVNKKNITNNK